MRASFTLRPFRVEVNSERVDDLYRIAARRQVDRLIAENRKLRRGLRPVPRFAGLSRRVEELLLVWIDRKYPSRPSTGGTETREEIEVLT